MSVKGQIREREGNEKNPFPQCKKKGNEKKNIPTIREREGNEIIHPHNSGTGREGKNPFPRFRNEKGMKNRSP